MAIPAKQIGWSQKSNLLWNISKQLETLIQVAGNIGINPGTTTTTSTSSSTTTTTTTTVTPTTTTTTTAAPTFYTYNGYYNGEAQTVYSADGPLLIGSTIYTDSALTTPYSLNGFMTTYYNFFTSPPYLGVISNINLNGVGLVVAPACDLASPRFGNIFTYPTFYTTLAEVYANNATLSGPGPITNHPLNGFTTISDGTSYYSYDYITGQLTGILDSCFNIQGSYATPLQASYSDDCYACNNVYNLDVNAFHSGLTIEVGTFLATDPGLTNGLGGNTYYSNGVYSYFVDGTSTVTSKVTCGARSFMYSINETNDCNDGTPIILYAPQNPGFPQSGAAGLSFYTDCALTIPYTYTGPAHDHNRIYDVVGGIFTYNSGCPSYIANFGLSNISGADACLNFSSSPTAVLSTYGITLAELVTYQSAIYYASNNQEVTASYISDGVNSYQIIQNYNGNGVPGVVDPPTSC